MQRVRQSWEDLAVLGKAGSSSGIPSGKDVTIPLGEDLTIMTEEGWPPQGGRRAPCSGRTQQSSVGEGSGSIPARQTAGKLLGRRVRLRLDAKV